MARRTAGADGNDAREPWVRIPAVVDSDLLAVAYGEGPALFQDSTRRVFAVGGRGTLIDCDPTKCRAIPTGTIEDLHAVAIAGGQAIAVGNGGTILHVTVDASERHGQWLAALHGVHQRSNSELLQDDLLRAERVDAGVTASLRAVSLECDENTRCRAKIFGEPAIVIEGLGSGPCDNGSDGRDLLPSSPGRIIDRAQEARRMSVALRQCSWTWTSRRASPEDARPERSIALPVHTETKRGLWRTERSKTDPVVLSTTVTIGSVTMPLSSPVEVRAAVATPEGGFVVGADGELYAVQ